MSTVIDYIAQKRSEYDTQSIDLPGGGEFNQSKQIDKDNLNWRSEYYDDAEDNVIGAYPYDNVVKPIILLEDRSTNFAVRHIEVDPQRQTRKSRVSAMISTKAIYKYARKYNLGKVLNDITFTIPKYGGVLVKQTQEGPKVVPWENVITDQVDIMSGPIIERLYFTPAELKKQKGWDNIDDAIRESKEEKEVDTDDGAEKNNTQGNQIEVFELHGEIPLDIYKDAKGEDYEEDDEFEFIQAIVVTTIVENKDGDFEGQILYVEKEKESPYMYYARNPQVGRALGESVFESLRENQKWHNYSKTEEVRMMAFAGKMLYVTNQPDALTNIFNGQVEAGTVLKLGVDSNNQPTFFKQLAQQPTGTPVYREMRNEWSESTRAITSSQSSVMGEEAKAGTPFRAQYLQSLQASSQFTKYHNDIGEELIRPMIEKWVLPDALKELVQEDELYTSFTPNELMLIDDVIIEKEVNRAVIDASLESNVLTPEEIEMIRQETQMKLSKEGKKRTIKGIKKFVAEAKSSVVINTTDEMRNKAVLFESYANLIGTLAPEDPRRDAIIDRIMDSMGVTTDELELYAKKALPTQPEQQQTAVKNPEISVKQLQAEQQPIKAVA